MTDTERFSEIVKHLHEEEMREPPMFTPQQIKRFFFAIALFTVLFWSAVVFGVLWLVNR